MAEPEERCGPRGVHGRFAVHWDTRSGKGERYRGSGGRSRRLFDGGELRLVMLKLIADEPRHGYDLIRAIEDMTGGAYAPSPGVVYPTLALLDEMGSIVEQHSDGAKKRFAATGDGRAHLVEQADRVTALMTRLGDLGSERNRVGWMRSPVRRAFGNLRQVVQNRVPAGDTDDDALHAIAALIDEAARKIERLP